jgi:hypothetical protein
MTMDLDGRVERLEQLLKVTPLDTDDSVIARFDEIRRFHAEIHRLWAGADGRKRRSRGRAASRRVSASDRSSRLRLIAGPPQGRANRGHPGGHVLDARGRAPRAQGRRRRGHQHLGGRQPAAGERELLPLRLDAYSGNEVAFACIEERCTSAAEPRLVAVRKGADGKPEQIHDHPVLDLFNANPFVDSYTLLASWIMYHDIGGNGFLEKVRSASGKVVELWPLRPDRMWVIPDANPNVHLRGWEYRLGADVYPLDARDVIHWKTRNGARRLVRDAALQAGGRTDRHLGGDALVHPSLLREQRRPGRHPDADQVDQPGPAPGHPGPLPQRVRRPARLARRRCPGRHEATYTPMGLPLGERGLVMPELDEILDAKTAMVSGVPLELIGARLGMIHGNRSTMKEARAGFWDETLAPIYREMAAVLTLGLPRRVRRLRLPGVRHQHRQGAPGGRGRQAQPSAIKQCRPAISASRRPASELGREPEFEPGAILVMPDNISGCRPTSSTPRRRRLRRCSRRHRRMMAAPPNVREVYCPSAGPTWAASTPTAPTCGSHRASAAGSGSARRSASGRGVSSRRRAAPSR